MGYKMGWFATVTFPEGQTKTYGPFKTNENAEEFISNCPFNSRIQEGPVFDTYEEAEAEAKRQNLKIKGASND